MPRTAFRHALAATTLLLAAYSPALAQPISADAPPAAPERAPAAEHLFKGIVQLPGQPLDFGLTIARTDAGWTGRMDVPLQGIRDAEVTNILFADGTLSFDFAPPGTNAQVRFSFPLAEDDSSADGTLSSNGQTVPASIERIEAGTRIGPNRPQEPTPPFPYTEREITLESAPGITLAGTLTLPPGEGPHPAVMFITGSGPQDRDETIAGHRPFAVIADHLARRGIASFRYDDRGMGGSTGQELDATIDDRISDARAVFQRLLDEPSLDHARIGIIGHSEGGSVGPSVAARDDRVAFLVLLAGMGVAGDEIITSQSAETLRRMGVDEPSIATISTAQRGMLDVILAGGSDDEIKDAVRHLLRAQNPGMAEAGIEQYTNQASGLILTTWYKSVAAYDPRPDFERVTCPVLAAFGELDVQVLPELNSTAMEQHFTATDDITLKTYEGLNHLFQPAETGMVDEYATIEVTISPELLEDITRWIRERTGLDD